MKIKDVPEIVVNLPRGLHKDGLTCNEMMKSQEELDMYNLYRQKTLETDLPDPHEVVAIDVEKLQRIIMFKIAGNILNSDDIAKAIAAKSKDILTWKDKV